MALPFFEIGMKTVATAEFSKFAGILSAALSQQLAISSKTFSDIKHNNVFLGQYLKAVEIKIKINRT